MQRRKFIQQAGLATLGIGLGGVACGHSHKKDAEVLILGAGLSGLRAAMLLDQQGISYKLLEGSGRIGGRLFTRDDFSSSTELGGVEIGDGYKRVVATANALNVPLVKPGAYPKSWLINLDGNNIVSSDWEKSTFNPLPEELKSLAPYRLESAALRGKLPFKTIRDWYHKDYASLDYPYSDFLKKAGYNDRAIQLANFTANHNGIDKVSTLQVMRALGYRMMGGSKGVLRACLKILN